MFPAKSRLPLQRKTNTAFITTLKTSISTTSSWCYHFTPYLKTILKILYYSKGKIHSILPYQNCAIFDNMIFDAKFIKVDVKFREKVSKKNPTRNGKSSKNAAVKRTKSNFFTNAVLANLEGDKNSVGKSGVVLSISKPKQDS